MNLEIIFGIALNRDKINLRFSSIYIIIKLFLIGYPKDAAKLEIIKFEPIVIYPQEQEIFNTSKS